MLGVPALFGRVAGCHSVPLLWPPLLLSKIYTCMVAAAGILLWRRGSFVVLVCEEGFWLPWCNWDVFNRERKTMIKRVWLDMRGGKMNFKNAIRICVRMCIYL